MDGYNKPLKLQCKVCGDAFTTDKDFAIKNKRVMCTGCCKSFDVDIQDSPQGSDWYKKYISLQNEEVKEEVKKEEELDEESVVTYKSEDYGFGF